MSNLIVFLRDKEVSTKSFAVYEEKRKQEIVRELWSLKKQYLGLGVPTFAFPQTPEFYEEKGVEYRNRTDVKVLLYGPDFLVSDIAELLMCTCKIEKDNGEVLEGRIISVECDSRKCTLNILGKEKQEIVYFEDKEKKDK